MMTPRRCAGVLPGFAPSSVSESPSGPGWIPQRRAILLALAALVSACVPLPAPALAGAPLSERAVIAYVGPKPDQVGRAEDRAYLDRADAVYRARFGETPRVSGVLLYPGSRLPRSLAAKAGVRLGPRERLLGMTEGGVVHLPRGGRYPLRSAFHELHHTVIRDGDHEHPSWRTVRQLGWALAQERWGWGWR